MGQNLRIQKASAGSGKTYLLALSYIRLLLGRRDSDSGLWRLASGPGRCRHRNILAITFTNKATEEMKQRIIRELAALASPTTRSDYRLTLMEQFGCDGPALAEAAGHALSDLLYDYGEFNISTIDAFFQSVLRSFAYEADISGNYDLRLDNEDMMAEAIAATLEVAAGAPVENTPEARSRRRRLRGWVQKYIGERVREGNSFDLYNPDSRLREDLARFVGNLSDESYHDHADELNSFFAAPGAVATLENELRSRLSQLYADMTRLAGEILASADVKLAGRKLNNLLARCGNPWPVTFTASHLELIASADVTDCVKPETPAELCDALTLLLVTLRHMLSIDVMLANIPNLGLFSEILATAERLKVMKNAILLSDTNVLLSRIIGDSDAPFIYERTGRRIRHFLIDEFQDTSRLQWNNLKPLLCESLSQDNENLIIGDVKQCIYRFRNSDPHLLDRELQQDPELTAHIDLSFADTNFRSATDIVDFNNRLFRALGRITGNTAVYDTVTQKPRVGAPDGYVDIALTDIPATEGLDRMVEAIARQLDPGRGGYSPRDIVVLVRDNKDSLPVVSRLLAETAPGGALPRGLGVVSDEALYISASGVVCHIIECLRDLCTASSGRQRSRSEAAMMPRDIDRVSERLETLRREGMTDDEALARVIEELRTRPDSETAEAPEAEAGQRMQFTGRSIYEIVEEILRDYPNPEKISEETAYINAFQDLLLDFSRSGPAGVHDFLTLWDKKLRATATIGISSGADAIRVMTIHKAKGLEFDCVHLPFVSKDLAKESGFSWYDTREFLPTLNLGCPTPPYFPLKQTAGLTHTVFAPQYRRRLDESVLDALNVLYVAFTRAGRELTVTVSSKKGATMPGPLISAALGQPADTLWRLTSGRPTTRASVPAIPATEQTDTLTIQEYPLCDRRDIWDFTTPGKESENDIF